MTQIAQCQQRDHTAPSLLRKGISLTVSRLGNGSIAFFPNTHSGSVTRFTPPERFPFKTIHNQKLNTEMKINWTKSIVAGIVGTILFDIAGFLMTGNWWDIPGIIGQKLGFGLIGGLPVHYGNGVALAVIYAALRPSLFGPEWFRAFAYTTAQTVLIVWFFMLPLLGAGIAGWDLNKFLPVITLVRHYAYMVPLVLMLSPNGKLASLFGEDEPLGNPSY